MILVPGTCHPQLIEEARGVAGFLSVGNEEALKDVVNDRELWNVLLHWEASSCREPGTIDGGTQIVAVVCRNESVG